MTIPTTENVRETLSADEFEHHPKPKSKPAKARKRRAAKIAKESRHEDQS